MQTLLIVDAYNLLFRAYYALPQLNYNGLPVGAAYGFINILLKYIANTPEYLIIASDTGHSTFREKIFPEYKINRPPVPGDLTPQFALLREMMKAFNFNFIECRSFEADDIIATITKKFKSPDLKIIILSSDKDLMQLVEENIFILDPLKDKLFAPKDVEEKFGVRPEQMIDFLSLVGDPSDNIPGVKGIGPKTAALLLQEFGSIENITLEKITKQKLKENLANYKEETKLSKMLVALEKNVPINLELSDLLYKKPIEAELAVFLEKYGFKNVLRKLINAPTIELATASKEPANSLASFTAKARYSGYLAIYAHEDTLYLADNENNFIKILKKPEAEIPSIIKELFFNKAILKIFHSDNFSFLNNYVFYDKVIVSPETLVPADHTINEEIREANNQLLINLHFEAPLNNKEINSGANSESKNKTKSETNSIHSNNINTNVNTSINSTSEDLKSMAYVLNTTRTSLPALLHDFADFEELPLPEKIVTNFVKIYQLLRQQLFLNQAFTLYYKVDRPLQEVIYQMCQKGIMVDRNYLKELFLEFQEKLIGLQKDIFAITGEEFLISSPKQLAEVLFEKMKLPALKKSKTGNYSTNSDVLENLDLLGFPIAAKLLEWRKFIKLQNTYIEPLIKKAEQDPNSIIRTNYNLNSTLTGRFSSSSPNLQNIPKENKIRRIFIARKGCKLLSADYSQVELRILSNIADVPELKAALLRGEDLHNITAAQVFETNNVTKELRNKAKAINFGIIYGISAFGLARQLNILKEEANSYIEKYFARYPGIKEYMETVKTEVRKNGYIKTMLGRRCYIENINSPNAILRSIAERSAINAPIQGTAADIIRKAIIKLSLDEEITNYLSLQIHDELVFEIPENRVSVIAEKIKNIMEQVTNIALKVDLRIGHSLGDLEPI